ncbi:peptidylprolyl isomerase [Chondromyces apiculatus]|uniref:peptidylprolyl isomerase n=1 Tax=Chondromyces apiculatus DSM 436 TaxID=1192034 RepID=A0A017TI94_9BACT|nr:peptidylprolyl isomerase [Chondromyces apiculatus]EYF08535.1 Peptidyl-prolyl cis-trans isomerase PpiA precursor [Chondromyces apiculatus DSM 436]
MMRHALTLVLFAGALAACESPTPEPKAEAPKPAATTAATTTKTVTKTATEAPKAKGPFPESTNAALQDPKKAEETAPATFKVKFETTAGDFEIECTRSWAPNGADRIYNLAKIGFFDDVAFFRAVKTPRPFMVQFGIHGNPEVSKHWRSANLKPDEVKGSNTRGMVTFAMAGSPDTRSTQLFINFADNSNLDKMGFAPVCKVVDPGMEVVDKIHSGYGERPSGAQGTIQMQGNKFLREKFPELDYIKTARLSDGKGSAAPSASAAASAAPSASAAASAAPSAAPAAPGVKAASPGPAATSTR